MFTFYPESISVIIFSPYVYIVPKKKNLFAFLRVDMPSVTGPLPHSWDAVKLGFTYVHIYIHSHFFFGHIYSLKRRVTTG